MAISLDRVQKSAAKKQNKKRRESTTAQEPGTQARPWSHRGLAREGRSPKERLGQGHAMHDELIEITDAPLFWLDPQQLNPRLMVQEFCREVRQHRLITRILTPRVQYRLHELMSQIERLRGRLNLRFF